MLRLHGGPGLRPGSHRHCGHRGVQGFQGALLCLLRAFAALLLKTYHCGRGIVVLHLLGGIVATLTLPNVGNEPLLFLPVGQPAERPHLLPWCFCPQGYTTQFAIPKGLYVNVCQKAPNGVLSIQVGRSAFFRSFLVYFSCISFLLTCECELTL